MIPVPTVIKYLSITFLALILSVIGVIFTFGYSAKKSLDCKNDPKEYKSIVAERGEISLYSFLPKEVHPSAEKVAFFHRSGFLQGSDDIILRVKLPREIVRQELAALENSKRQEVSPSDLPDLLTFPSYDASKRTGNDIAKALKELPTDYRVFLFETDLAQVKKHTNHNSLAFTAVSLTSNEIVYYVTQW